LRGEQNAMKKTESIVSDDRGAIMVLGIFMCTFLVGSLWYIAGIGDAIMYHERMQEAADAVAFSGAVIQARGMNIIVLLNLIMAAILAIRVAINVTKAMFLILGGLLAASIIFSELAPTAFEGAELMQDLDNMTKQPIDLALEALHGAEVGVKRLTPAAAILASEEIATKYKPLVTLPVLVLGRSIGTGGGGGGGAGTFQLPVVDGTTHKLCMEAFNADAEFLQAVFPAGIGSALGSATKFVGGIINSLGASDLFCELGSGAPDLTSAVQSATQGQCDQQQQDACSQSDQAQSDLTTAYAQNRYDSSGNPLTNPAPTPAQTAAVNNAKTAASSAKQACDDAKNCQKKATNAVNDKAQQLAASATAGTTGNKNPAQVDPNWYNGTLDAQIISAVGADATTAKFLDRSSKFEQIAAQFYKKATVKYDSPGKFMGFGAAQLDPKMNAWAQAEFFYDCSGAWQSGPCNDDEEAMWNFHWRARFRLVNPQASIAAKYIAGADLVMKGRIAVDEAMILAHGGLSVSQIISDVQTAATIGRLVNPAGEPLTLH
ncbi:MAG: hypothetical protein FWD17_12040, partial [Polyangiaceae bacterium]|nr:hypothetical protein [Polyangiaceae bacterium]